MAFGRQIAGGVSRIAGLGLGFWETSRGSEVRGHKQGLLWPALTFQEPPQIEQTPFKRGYGPRAGDLDLER